MWCRPGPRFVEEPGDRRIRRGGLEQFETATDPPGRKCARTRWLGTSSGRLDVETERVAIEGERGVADPRRRCRHDRERLSYADWRSHEASRSPRSDASSVSRRCTGSDLARRDPVDHRAELARRQHLLLELLHEALRHQLAQAILAARAAGVSAAGSRRVRAELRRSRPPARPRPRPSSPRSS